MTDYRELCSQLEGFAKEERGYVPLLSNASAVLFRMLEKINWAGFYLTGKGERENTLILGPFQGKPACIRIPYGKGVCGTAAESGRVQRVPDVHAFPGHIACDCDSRSEIVIPIRLDGHIVGVLDIDSPVEDRFSEEDEKGLGEFVRVLEQYICFD